MDDKLLIDKLLEQNDHAFSILIEKYQKLVYATVFRLVRNQADAEDIFQEVFIEVYRSVSYLRNENDLSGWLFRISYNKSISFLRKKNPAKATGQLAPGEMTVLMAYTRLVDKETPACKLEQREANQILFTAIDRLPEMQKKVLLMHKFEDYSHKEICEKLDISIASVESLIYRAKTSLRKSLHVYYIKHSK